MVMVVSFYILSFSGATYIFGIYSGAIKSSLHYDQETIGTLSFFKDLGANVGIISGLMNEVFPAWSVLAVGAGMNLFGYLMVWLAVTHKIAQPPVWQIYLYLCIGANSQTFANTGVLVTCVKNFPQSRGVVLGLVKGCVGLSGAIFTQVYHAIYGQDTSGVILLIGWLPSVVTLVFMFFVRPLKPEMDKRQDKHFFSFLYLALLLAAFLMLIIILENQLPFSSMSYKAMAAITLLFVAANVLIAGRAEHEKFGKEDAQISSNGEALELSSTSKKQFNLVKKEENGLHDKKLPTAQADTSSNLASQESDSLFQSSGGGEEKDLVESSESSNNKIVNPTLALPSIKDNSQQANNNNASSKPKLITRFKLFFSNWPKRGEDFTIPQAVLSLDMCILFIATTCGVGATLTAIDNMGQIGASLGYSTVSISTFVGLISIWNFLGRIIAGFLSELLLKKYRFPRTLMLTIVLGLACVGHILIAFPGPGTLYIASILVGLCFGAQWPLLFAVISELFGLKYYATLYNVGGIASPLGSYVLSVKVAGYLYDREARRQQAALLSSTTAGSSELTCYGSECFRLTFVIMTIVSAFGSLISAVLVMRTRKFYSQDIYAKFHGKPDEDHQVHGGDATSTS